MPLELGSSGKYDERTQLEPLPGTLGSAPEDNPFDGGAHLVLTVNAPPNGELLRLRRLAKNYSSLFALRTGTALRFHLPIQSISIAIFAASCFLNDK